MSNLELKIKYTSESDWPTLFFHQYKDEQFIFSKHIWFRKSKL